MTLKGLVDKIYTASLSINPMAPLGMSRGCFVPKTEYSVPERVYTINNGEITRHSSRIVWAL